MLNHLNILLNVISLMAGAGAVIFIIHTYKASAYPFLKFLLYFIILYNLVIIIDVTSMYSCVNLMDNCLAFKSTAFAGAIGPLSSLFFIMMTYFHVKMMFAILNKNISTNMQRLIYIGFGIIVSSYIARITFSLLRKHYLIFSLIQSTLLQIAFIVVVISLVWFLIQGLRINDAHKRRIILPFGIFYLTTFTGLVLLGMLLNPANRILIPVISLLFNVAPFFGIKYLFLPYHHHTLTQNQGEAILDSLCNKYKISKREREIAELILLGNSNKEIEDKLFISLNTVKNHIYNLYQKLGVKSRGQLVHFILEFEKR